MDEDRIERSRGNIYADLGFEDPELELAKAKLASRIDNIIRDRKLTQAAAGELAGESQPNLSKVVRGDLGDFSIERLMKLLRKFDQDVQIVVSPSDQPGRLIATVPMSDDHALAAASPAKKRVAKFP
jgi:predicted XRE-type DNA-binding protein